MTELAKGEAGWEKTVYSKTGKALEELTERRYGLKAKARQLLVLLDGNRPLGELSGMMSSQELRGLLHDLREGGFIERQIAGGPPKAIQPIQVFPAGHSNLIAEQAPEPPLDPVRLTRTKAYLIETSQQHLGLMAAKLQQEIAQADDATQLRSALAHWNMAIRESLAGSDVASACLSHAHELIGWKQ